MYLYIFIYMYDHQLVTDPVFTLFGHFGSHLEYGNEPNLHIFNGPNFEIDMKNETLADKFVDCSRHVSDYGKSA